MKRSLVRAFRLASALLVILALVAALAVPNPLTASVDQPAERARPLPHTDVNPLAASVFLDREVELWKKEQTLKMAREAGLGWVKQMFSWEEIEPQRGVYWNEVSRVSTWQKFDEIVQLAEKYGLRITVRLDRAPAWARPPGSARTSPPSSYEDFGNFVYEVVNRYRGRIQHYQIWNEPNLAAEWGDLDVDPDAYVQLLQVAYRRAKEADPSALIMSAPLAQTLEPGPRNQSDVDYLRAMYSAGLRGYFDILGANAYGFEHPPDDPPSVDRLNFQRVQLLRQIAVENGDADKPVWLNEVAWNAAPASFPTDKLTWRRVSEQQQAEYTARAVELARSWDWVGVIGLWYFRQVGDIPASDATYYFRMVDVDFTPRPLYRTIQKLGMVLAVAGPGLHQETASAVLAQGRWEPRLLPEASGQGVLVSRTPGDSLALTFEGTDVDLVVARGPDAGLIYVYVDGAPASGLPRNREGQAYVDLRRPSPASAEHFTVARGLAPGRHALQIVVGDRGLAGPVENVTVDGFVVRSKPPSLWQFYGVMALVALGLLGVVSSIRLGRHL